MTDELSEKQTQEILKVLDDLLEQGPWDSSNFLTLIGKKLRDIRDNFALHTNNTGKKNGQLTSDLASRMALRSGQIEIFILLYSSSGNQINSWNQIVNNLPRQVVSRPVYSSEDDVKEMIRTKVNPQNEAYVSVYIRKEDILEVAPDKIPYDKLGKPLLILKNHAIKLDNIHQFIHTSGFYTYAGGRLIKSSSNERD